MGEYGVGCRYFCRAQKHSEELQKRRGTALSSGGEEESQTWQQFPLPSPSVAATLLNTRVGPPIWEFEISCTKKIKKVFWRMSTQQ